MIIHEKSLCWEMNALLYLSVDTSGTTASVAICDENGIIAENTLATKLTHSQIILPMVKKLFADAELEMSDIDCIAVSEGPGSYTGLRIGIAAVKGMCMSLGCECRGVSTLKALAYNVSACDATVLSILKARKGIVYFGAYKAHRGSVKCVYPDRVCSVDEVREFAEGVQGAMLIVGDCCDEIKEAVFADMDNVMAAPPKDRLQQASSVCFAAMSEGPVTAQQLQAVYLQETKAEKDSAHRDK